MDEIEHRGISTIRGLAMDMPNQAKSGHQGTAMSLAPAAHVLWTRIMKYDSKVPQWPDRDRFVLSAGHASVLLYSMLHLTGYDLSLDDLKEFRQWGSKTPGHPERGHTAGVEVTTGPLGQGVANAVGLAIAEEQLRARYGSEVCDHRTFAICSDGDLEEGISHEAASLAGHLGLERLTLLYDDNHISIDGPTELSLSDDAAARFRAYGWHVEELGEVGDDLDAIEAGIRQAMEVEGKPSIVILRTVIATPATRSANNHEAHGYALFDEEIAETKTFMGMDPNETFAVSESVAAYYHEAGQRGRAERDEWESRLANYGGNRADYEASMAGTGVEGWASALPTFEVGESIATRKASGNCLQALVPVVPGLMGGGADLTGNTGTTIKDHGVFSPEDRTGRQIYFGIREHAMGGIANGMAAHGGVIPVVGTFLVFSDYMRGAVRLAALSKTKVIYSWTHDSVGVGEDGPTHQPIEHVAALRAIPDLQVIRPADANETAHAWRLAIDTDGPTALILSRQNLPVLDGTADGAVDKGGYVLIEREHADVTLVGTGSEVSVCVEAAALLESAGIVTRVVSLPSFDRFIRQDAAYRTEVLGMARRLGVEAGVSFGWHRWVDEAVGIDRFGASAPGDTVMKELGISPENVAARAQALLHA